MEEEKDNQELSFEDSLLTLSGIIKLTVSGEYSLEVHALDDPRYLIMMDALDISTLNN